MFPLDSSLSLLTDEVGRSPKTDNDKSRDLLAVRHVAVKLAAVWHTIDRTYIEYLPKRNKLAY